MRGQREEESETQAKGSRGEAQCCAFQVNDSCYQDYRAQICPWRPVSSGERSGFAGLGLRGRWRENRGWSVFRNVVAEKLSVERRQPRGRGVKPLLQLAAVLF